MAQDAIEQIMLAEEQAALLCRVANERAEEARSEMQRICEERYAKIERIATAKKEQSLDEVRARMQRLQEKKTAEIEAEAEALAAALREDRIAEAVRRVVWGILEKCQ